MNTEDYVTYEQAVKLKELGFNWKCNNYYKDESCDYNYESKDYNEYWTIISAPTLSQAAKWLREKGLFIEVWICRCGCGWSMYKCNQDVEYITKSNVNNFTYEKALSNAIDKALQILEQEENDNK